MKAPEFVLEEGKEQTASEMAIFGDMFAEPDTLEGKQMKSVEHIDRATDNVSATEVTCNNLKFGSVDLEQDQASWNSAQTPLKQQQRQQDKKTKQKIPILKMPTDTQAMNQVPQDL